MESDNALVLSESNLVQAALWCGGRVVEERDALDDTKVTRALNVPTFTGVERAYVGDLITQDGNTVVFFKIVRGLTAKP